MFRKKERRTFIGGYRKAAFALNTMMNVIVGLLMIILSAPLICVIAILIKLQKNNGPVIYKATRLGYKKKPFTMYKFCTLPPEAENIVGARHLTLLILTQHNLTNPFMRFLRETHLDELPQLFNLLKGDMDLIGPRPLRNIIYETICKHTRIHDARFMVKPGIVGYSQLFVAASAPRRIQFFIDNRYAIRKQNVPWDILFFFYGILVLARNIIKYIAEFLWNSVWRSKILKRYKEKRKLKRFFYRDAHVWFGTRTNGDVQYDYQSRLINTNEEAVLVYSNHEIEHNTPTMMRMELLQRVRRGKNPRKHTALCHCNLYKKWTSVILIVGINMC